MSRLNRLQRFSALALVVVLAPLALWLRAVGPASGAEGTGQVAGWVYWSWCPTYGSASATEAGPAGGPTIVQPRPFPVPAFGALVAIQGTSLAAKTDEEGFFLIDNVPLGTYYTVAAGYPRRTPLPAATSGADRPAAPAIAPVVCLQGSSMRANVIVSDLRRPANVGALMIGRTGPFPLQPGRQAAEPTDEEIVP